MTMTLHFGYLLLAMGGLVAIACMLSPSIANWLASPIESLYAGGKDALEPRPLYSIAETFRKRGQYHKSAAEIRRQLAMFPNDFEGWMKLAELQATDMNDLPLALETVERILVIPELPPGQVAFALGRVADWDLGINSDRAAARAALERVGELLPNSAEAQIAAQRIAHLASDEHLAEMRNPHVIALKHYEEKIGLRGETVKAPEPESPAERANHLVRHLGEFPSDNHAREQLALTYGNELQRLDLAISELETLISNPGQLPKNIVHWLNLAADLHIRVGNDAAAARAALQRIIDLYPNGAAAANANVRISQLRLELNQGRQQRTVKLGNYEQNVGLRKMDSAGRRRGE